MHCRRSDYRVSPVSGDGECRGPHHAAPHTDTAVCTGQHNPQEQPPPAHAECILWNNPWELYKDGAHFNFGRDCGF